MLKEPTVFVIGAGAGWDIDMPLGSTLSSQIASKLDIRYDVYTKISGDDEIAEALKRYVKTHNGGDFNDWRAAGVSIKDGVQYTRSIDNFVNSHSNNEKLAVCAKLGILHTISLMAQ